MRPRHRIIMSIPPRSHHSSFLPPPFCNCVLASGLPTEEIGVQEGEDAVAEMDRAVGRRRAMTVMEFPNQGPSKLGEPRLQWWMSIPCIREVGPDVDPDDPIRQKRDDIIRKEAVFPALDINVDHVDSIVVVQQRWQG